MVSRRRKGLKAYLAPVAHPIMAVTGACLFALGRRGPRQMCVSRRHPSGRPFKVEDIERCGIVAGAREFDETLSLAALEARADPQEQSALFAQLPYEVRQQILEYVVVPDGAVHLFGGRDERAALVVCQGCWCGSCGSPCDSGEHRSRNEHGLCRTSMIYDAWYATRFRDRSLFPPHHPGVLRSCRRAYVEGMRILYNKAAFQASDALALVSFANSTRPDLLLNTRTLTIGGLATVSFCNFSFNSWQSFFMGYYPGLLQTAAPMQRFIPTRGEDEDDCPGRLYLPAHNSQIWLEFWETIATRMPGLRDLTVTINTRSWRYSHTRSDAWAVPLKRIRGLSKFNLTLLGHADESVLEGIKKDILAEVFSNTQPRDLDDLFDEYWYNRTFPCIRPDPSHELVWPD